MRLRGALLLALLLAGCTTAPAAEGPGGTGGGADGAPAFRLPVPVSVDAPGAEPVVAVASDGTVYVQGIGRADQGNVNKVWRSDDDGATWTDVTPPAFGQERSNDGFVAVGNGDRVYAANVFSLTLQLYRSDDRGATWTPLPVPRLPLLMHRHWIVPHGGSTVHLAVEGLPPAFLPWLAGQAPPAEVTGTPNDGMWYLRSDDLGATWSAPVHVDPRVNFAGQGPMAVSPDGQGVFIARYEDDAGELAPRYESGRWYLLASEDGGGTWERREMLALTSELSTAVPGLAVDAAGTLHFAWSQAHEGRSRVMLARSTDGGRSWSAPWLLPAEGTHAMAWVVAREEPGRVGVLWYAADANATARETDEGTEWFVEYADVTGAGTAAPQARLARVTPAPVHLGNVCAKGPACGPGEDRSLLDYPWMALGPDGRVHAVFGSTMWDRPSAFAVHAVEAR